MQTGRYRIAGWISRLRPNAPGSVVRLADARDADDVAALERCLAGEREAFAVLVHRHASGVFGLCARMVGSSLADELTQETFARAFAKLADFRRDAQLRHWLYRIALNICRDHLKSGKAREDTVGDSGVVEPLDTNDPERQASAHESLRSLAAAIERLPPKYREAFVLKHLENLPYEEIKIIARMPIPALKVRVHRAREMLRKMLGDAAAGF
jgi:RNA polymerase sigma-70 factor (ECF subfamily)